MISDFDLRGFQLPADLDVDFTLSNRFELGETDLGVSVAGLYDSEWRYVEEQRAEIIADASGSEFVGESSALERTENDIMAGAILNATADIGFNHTLTFTSLLSRESRKGTFFEQGFNRSDDRDFRRVILEFTESELFFQPDQWLPPAAGSAGFDRRVAGDLLDRRAGRAGHTRIRVFAPADQHRTAAAGNGSRRGGSAAPVRLGVSRRGLGRCELRRQCSGDAVRQRHRRVPLRGSRDDPGARFPRRPGGAMRWALPPARATLCSSRR
ncbi:MAG: hypothetical protein U5R48_17710 [Gammaproteobacteria bacterium]|nr:hypothetical protein [Gammaproteobacteria bacterium]